MCIIGNYIWNQIQLSFVHFNSFAHVVLNPKSKPMGKLLIIIGIVCIMAGVLITYLPRIPFLGKLPGDISIERENFKFYFPLGTSILVSIILSLLLFLYNKLKN
jgi:hypothetical protein